MTLTCGGGSNIFYTSHSLTLTYIDDTASLVYKGSNNIDLSYQTYECEGVNAQVLEPVPTRSES